MFLLSTDPIFLDEFINGVKFGLFVLSIGVGTAMWYSPLGLSPNLTDSEIAAGKSYIWDEDAHQADTNSPKTVGWALT